jgi:hypothetical protein
MPIDPFIEPGEFDSVVIATLSDAFDAACQEMQYAVTRAVREVIAERIIAAARIGERDPVRLRAAALAGLPREEE